MTKQRFTRKEVKEVTETEIVSVTCDFCGKLFPYPKNETPRVPVGEITITFGYGSKHDNWKFSGDICDDCFDKLQKDKNFDCQEIIWV